MRASAHRLAFFLRTSEGWLFFHTLKWNWTDFLPSTEVGDEAATHTGSYDCSDSPKKMISAQNLANLSVFSSVAIILLAISFNVFVDSGASRRDLEGPVLPFGPGHHWYYSEINNFGTRKKAGGRPLFLMPSDQAEQSANCRWSLMEKQCCSPACCLRRDSRRPSLGVQARFPSKEQQAHQSDLSANLFSVASSHILSKPLQEHFGDI